MKKTKFIRGIGVIALTVILSVGCFTAFAAGADNEADEMRASEAVAAPLNTDEEVQTEESVPEQSEYSYLTGQQRSTKRNDLYVQAEQLPEEERDAFLAENGVGETPYSQEAAESYSYVAGQQRGASYRQSDDNERTQDVADYGYLTGQERGASYQR